MASIRLYTSLGNISRRTESGTLAYPWYHGKTSRSTKTSLGGVSGPSISKTTPAPNRQCRTVRSHLSSLGLLVSPIPMISSTIGPRFMYPPVPFTIQSQIQQHPSLPNPSPSPAPTNGHPPANQTLANKSARGDSQSVVNNVINQTCMSSINSNTGDRSINDCHPTNAPSELLP